jgi:hypothetical protein
VATGRKGAKVPVEPARRFPQSGVFMRRTPPNACATSTFGTMAGKPVDCRLAVFRVGHSLIYRKFQRRRTVSLQCKLTDGSPFFNVNPRLKVRVACL